jgi:hypothetical protein
MQGFYRAGPRPASVAFAGFYKIKKPAEAGFGKT